MTDCHTGLQATDGIGDGSEGCISTDGSEESVDPRVQVELERLNAATDLINKLEIELDEARSNFRLLLSDSSQRVNQLAKTLGSCVEKARPYYEARMQAKQLQARTQKAALRYERASSAHAAAKEMVYLAEEGLKKEGRCFDPAWQEMLNHATMRVNEAESERILSQRDHQHTSLAYNEAEKTVQQLHQEVKRAIVKSSLSTRRGLLQLNNLANEHQLQLLPYFEMKARFNHLLDDQRQNVHRLEENVLKVKLSYADALHNLEEISDEIHQRRQQQDEPDACERSQGVGAESPDTAGSHFVKMPYCCVSRRTVSSEDIFSDHYNAGDSYKSLPSKLNPRISMLTNSGMTISKDNQTIKSPSSPPVDLQSESSSLSTAVFSSQCADSAYSVADLSKMNFPSFQADDATYSTKLVENRLKQLSLEADNTRLGAFGTVLQEMDRSPEGAEISNQKHHAVDLNILRVQKEDLSDSESLASNDTADTLDDNQIECLLLDRAFPNEYQDRLSLSDSPCANGE